MSLSPLRAEYYARSNSWAIRGQVLDATSAPSDGTWHDLEGFFPFTVTLEGTYTGTCQVCVSNYPVRPPDSWHGSPFGSLVGDNGGNRLIDGPYRWVKVRVLVLTAGQVEGYAFGYDVGHLFS